MRTDAEFWRREFRAWELERVKRRDRARLLLSVIALLVLAAAVLGACNAWAGPGQANDRGGGNCRPGGACVVKSIKTTGTSTSSVGSYSVQLPHASGRLSFCDGGGNCNWWYATNSASNGLIMTNGGGGASFSASGPGWFANGTAANPSVSFTNDTNTGLYTGSADTLSLTLGGSETFRWRTGGLSMLVGQQPTAFSASAPSLQSDANTGRAYWSETSTTASTPPYDFGGNAHPVLQRRTYLVDVGTESSAAPTWNPGPRTGATTATITVSETSAGATSSGSAPYVFDFRTSTTSTVAGNIASVTGSSSGVKLSRGPRWCQRVMPGATITATRIWAGLASALPTASDTMTGEGVLFRYSTVAGDTKWQICTRDGATQTCTDTGVGVVASTPAILCADCREAGACTAWVDGVARVRKTTNLPAAGTNMNPLWTVETTAGGTARTVGVSSASVEFN